MSSAKTAVVNSFNDERENGLIDLKFFPGDHTTEATENQFYKEVESMNHAIQAGEAKLMSFGDTKKA